MDLAIYTSIRSPHLMPLARSLSHRLGRENFHYIYTVPHDKSREGMGWGIEDEECCEYAGDGYGRALEVDCLITSFRDTEVIRHRLNLNKRTFYLSERWFKPPVGLFRLCNPGFSCMANDFCRYLDNSDFGYLAIGIHAARDFIRLYELLHEKKLSRMRYAPLVAFESYPGGAILPVEEALNQELINQKDLAFAQKYGFCQIPQEKWNCAETKGVYSKIKIWGYFVSPSQERTSLDSRHGILWVGRLIPWKNTSTLIKVCSEYNLPLDIYGDGPLKKDLEAIAAPCVHFHPFVPIDKIRDIMSRHKTYVLPSKAYEGWGAVINEAMEEGMLVYASLESGAGATMLPVDRLFPAWDRNALAQLLLQDKTPISIGEWNAECAADYIVNQLMNKWC